MKQLDPKAVWLFFLNYIFQWIILMMLMLLAVVTGLLSVLENIGFTGNIWFTLLTILLLPFPIILGACYVWAKLVYKYYRYELVEDGFRKEFGVITKKYVTIPYDRIQNVDIYRGILARILGLSDLNIQTAGMSATFNKYGIKGTSAEGRLPALSQSEAEFLRDELIRRARHPRKHDETGAPYTSEITSNPL